MNIKKNIYNYIILQAYKKKKKKRLRLFTNNHLSILFTAVHAHRIPKLWCKVVRERREGRHPIIMPELAAVVFARGRFSSRV